MSKHEKDGPGVSFSKLFSVSVSEFCHQINFDGNELFTRPDTLNYLFVNTYMTRSVDGILSVLIIKTLNQYPNYKPNLGFKLKV